MFEMDSKYTLFEVNVKAIAASYYKEGNACYTCTKLSYFIIKIMEWRLTITLIINQ